MGQDTKYLAAIRLRGLTGIRSEIEHTLNMLSLYKKNYCSVLPNNQIFTGMLRKAKDYITWGEIDDNTFSLLVEKKGEMLNERELYVNRKSKRNSFLVVGNKKIKKYFRLSPPRKGFGRIGIKRSFQEGGSLGYRGEAINNLIKRMA